MKGNFIVANTYFQLIIVINLVLIDISVGAEKIVKKLKKTKLFNNIYVIKYKKLDSENKKI